MLKVDLKQETRIELNALCRYYSKRTHKHLLLDILYWIIYNYQEFEAA
jgi:hypothetical protein